MAKTKAVTEQRESTEAAPPKVERRPEEPAKQSRPILTVLSQHAAFPPSTALPRSTDTANHLPVIDASGRARLAGGLQRSMGNAGMSRMYGSSVQTKLKVSTPNDPYEQEADRMADEIMRGLSSAHISESPTSPVRLRVPQEAAASNNIEQTSEMDRSLSSAGQSLDENTRHLMEQRLQHDFSRVRVHTDNEASESARSLQASAYTVGTDIVFANGRYAPNSEEGMALLAHELVHVKQQTPVGDGVRRKLRIQREEGAGSPAPQDPCASAPRSVAQSLLGEGREGRGRTFAPRLTPAENRRWAALPEACRNNREQCTGRHSHEPRPRTPWSLVTLHGRIHAGMDVQARRSTPVYAPIRGRVLQVGDTGGTYGNIVMLLHQCPPHTEQFGDRPVTTIYAHMESIAASVTLGATVEAGDQIGTVGDTGVPGRVHLHFSVQRVPRSGPPRAASSTYEERRDIRIRPDDWLAALGIPIAPTVTVQPAVTQPAQQTPPVVQPNPESAPIEREGAIQRKALFTRPRSTSGIIQRTPFDDSDPVTRLQRGMTLPYREATELLDCIDIMGESSSDYCYQQVLGMPAPARRPGAIPPSTTGTAPATIAAPSTPVTGLNVSSAGVVHYATPSGNFYRFPAGPHHTNRTDRPQIQNPASVMVTYSGTGSNAFARVHPAVVSTLDTMMSAMHAEGLRINDESLKQARVVSGFRAPTLHEGNLYLAALRRTISSNPTIFGTLTFPSSIEAQARSELGFTGSPAHRSFEAAVAAQPGWSASLARQLIRITARYKAPRGGSTHHSGVVIDIDFPYATGGSAVHWHGVNRARNAAAFRSAAGVWLNTYAMTFDFDTYDTSMEIWHQEWRNWAGTSADPSVSPTASP